MALAGSHNYMFVLQIHTFFKRLPKILSISQHIHEYLLSVLNYVKVVTGSERVKGKVDTIGVLRIILFLPL